MVCAAGRNHETKILEALIKPISPPMDNTEVAKTRGGVRRII